MTALEIQKGAKLMPNEAFYGELGAMAACTLRFAVMHQLSRAGSPHCGVKGDSWVGLVKTCSSLCSRGIEGVFQVKTRHKDYPKVFIEDALKGMPGGVHLVINGVNKVIGEKLVAVGYWYQHPENPFFYYETRRMHY